LAAVFVPFGFDVPSSWGLDFGHFLVLAGLYLCAWLYGLALAIALRRWRLLVGQLAVPALLAMAVSGGALVL
jgi:hypothetical protein